MMDEPLYRSFESFLERHRHTIGDPIHFLGRAGNLMRYALFLETVLLRYRTLAEARHTANTALQASLSIGENMLSPEQQELLARTTGMTPAIHLDIESFYVFAKILLDRWSQFLQYWFGDVRSVSLNSHDKLTKHIIAFTDAHSLPRISSDINAAMVSMHKRISDYRDYQITHPWSPDALRGTMGQLDDPYCRIAGWGSKGLESETPVTLLPELRQYLQLWIHYVDDNAAKSRWRKEPE